MPPPERIDACLRRTYDDGSFGGNHVLGLRMSLRSVERSAHNEAYVQQRISVAHNSSWIAGLRLLFVFDRQSKCYIQYFGRMVLGHAPSGPDRLRILCIRVPNWTSE